MGSPAPSSEPGSIFPIQAVASPIAVTLRYCVPPSNTGNVSMRLWVFLPVATVLVAGCVSSSEIVSIGNGHYMITGRASGGLNAGKETTAATKAANAYCANQSKQMVLLNLDKTGNAAVFGENISLTFTCQ
jgi:hypothetical protein